jgi:transposase InsO family protein
LEFIDHIKDLTSVKTQSILNQLTLNRSTYHNWRTRQSGDRLTDKKPVGRNPAQLLEWEEDAIVEYYLTHQDQGYRRITFMMIDEDITYVSSSTVYRCLKRHGLLLRWLEYRSIGSRPALPCAPNEKWHTDLMLIEIDGILYYYQGIIDAYSRYIIAWDIHAEGTALNTSLVLQEAYDNSPPVINPVVITDNGPEFIGKEFREVIKQKKGKDVRITAYHPQSNGIKERFHRTLREEGITRYNNLIDAKIKIGEWIEYYNTKRLHSAIDYMAPEVWHYGNPAELKKERIEKIKLAREERKVINLTKP